MFFKGTVEYCFLLQETEQVKKQLRRGTNASLMNYMVDPESEIVHISREAQQKP